MKKFYNCLLLVVFLKSYGLAQPPPAIFNVFPLSGPVGTTVTIEMQGFDGLDPSLSIVHFGAVKGLVEFRSINRLIVRVPFGVTNEPISVTNSHPSRPITAFYDKPFTITFGVAREINPNSFASGVLFPAGGYLNVMAVGDIDSDGKPDLAATNSNEALVTLFRNIATTNSINSGSLATATLLSTGQAPAGIQIVDLDADGKKDILQSNSQERSMSVFRNITPAGGVGSFEPRRNFSPGTIPNVFDVNDINKDGKPDLVVLNSQPPYNIVVFQNYSNTGGIFIGVNYAISLPERGYYIKLRDLDGDNRPEIIVAKNQGILIYRNLGVLGTINHSSFAPPITLGFGGIPGDFDLADMDGNGKIDIVVPSEGTNVWIYRNESTVGSFAFPISNFALRQIPVSVKCGDINGDGKPEMVVAEQDLLEIFANNSSPGNTNYASAVSFPIGFKATSIQLVDMDSDSKPDIVATNILGSAISIFKNQIGGFDTEAPVLQGIMPDITVECGQDVPVAVVTATDNSAPSLPVSYSSTIVGDPCHKVETRTWTATDAAGNTVEGVQRITYVDRTPPEVSFQPRELDRIIECGIGAEAGLTAALSAGDFAIQNLRDNCSSSGIVSHSEEYVGVNLVRKWIVGDECGNVTEEIVQTIFFPADDDGDGVGNDCDICPNGNDADDADGDGIPAACDACPLAATNDADGDGLCDDIDPCPADALNDDDGDGICGSFDNCPFFANPYQDDTDGDGVGDDCDADDDNDGFEDDNDCSPLNALINPNAVEICNGLDDDCDGLVDEGFEIIYYLDLDGDRYGGQTKFIFNPCVIQMIRKEWVTNNLDCDDTNPNIHPGKAEICDNIDNNCDGQTDEGLPQIAYYADTDEDGLGDPNLSIMACSQPPGYVLNDGDNCPSVANPTRMDSDFDGIGDACDSCPLDADNDADHDGICGDVDSCPLDPLNDEDGDGICGSIDNCPAQSNPDQIDTDGDGVGDACDNDDDSDGVEDSGDNCPLLANAAQQDFDLDGIGDLCDEDDDNDGMPDLSDCAPLDPTIHTPVKYFADTDGDGFGNASSFVTLCSKLTPDGFVTNSSDCIDNDAAVYPGAAEMCDGKDNNCNGVIDDNQQLTTWYLDQDQDNYYESTVVSIKACSQPVGYASQGGDCNDNNPKVNPGAIEICDGLDNDCNGRIDERCVTAIVPGMRIADVVLNENAGTAFVSVTLSEPVFTNEITVRFRTANGTARSRRDYEGVNGQLVFAPGTTLQIIEVPIISDNQQEATEYFEVNLSNERNANLLDGQALVTIKEGILTNADKKQGLQEPVALKPKITVLPNPSRYQFILKMVGMSSEKPVRINITDVLGRVIESHNKVITAEGLIFGNSYRPGVYLVEVIQGNQRSTFKIIKSYTY